MGERAHLQSAGKDVENSLESFEERARWAKCQPGVVPRSDQEADIQVEKAGHVSHRQDASLRAHEVSEGKWAAWQTARGNVPHM